MHEMLGIDRALLIHDIWLDKILSGKKTWEMRSTKTRIRGKIGLIESGSGLIVGEAELVDSLDAIPAEHYHQYTAKHWIPRGLPSLCEKYRFPWVLSNARRYPVPVPYEHPRGAVIWVKL